MAIPQTTKAFISLGKFKVINTNGVEESIERFVAMTEENAKYIGATYSTLTPAPRTVTIKTGKRAGRKYTIDYSASLHRGTAYRLGFNAGFKSVGKPAKRVPKIKWISFYVPKGVNLKQFMSIIFTKMTKKPIHLKMPSGATTRIQEAK